MFKSHHEFDGEGGGLEGDSGPRDGALLVEGAVARRVARRDHVVAEVAAQTVAGDHLRVK